MLSSFSQSGRLSPNLTTRPDFATTDLLLLLHRITLFCTCLNQARELQPLLAFLHTHPLTSSIWNDFINAQVEIRAGLCAFGKLPEATLLHVASAQGYIDVVQALLDHGANLRILTGHNDLVGRVTAITLAARQGRTGCLRLLLTHPQTRNDVPFAVNAQDADGDTALNWASKNRFDPCSRVLLSQPGIDPTLQDMQGWAAIHHAVSGQAQAYEQLILTGEPQFDLLRDSRTVGIGMLDPFARRGEERVIPIIQFRPAAGTQELRASLVPLRTRRDGPAAAVSASSAFVPVLRTHFTAVSEPGDVALDESRRHQVTAEDAHFAPRAGDAGAAAEHVEEQFQQQRKPKDAATSTAASSSSASRGSIDLQSFCAHAIVSGDMASLRRMIRDVTPEQAERA